MRTLVLLRHGKSDWGVGVSDRERPLAERGRRQVAEAGVWLADHGPILDLALVSTARRAFETWDLASGQLDQPPPMRLKEAAYAFDGDDLIGLIHRLDAESAVALVGHNPALEELLTALTGEVVAMRTSALAVVELTSWQSAGDGHARLLAHGRPPLA